MNKIIRFTLLSVLGLSLASCEDEFDINKLQDDPKLLVYCFPTESDSTAIAIYRTVPVNTDTCNLSKQAHQTVDAHVVYKINGQEMAVKRITEEDCPHFSANIDHPERMVGQYYAIGHQKAGDKIEVEVETEGFPKLTASTYIPKRVAVKIDTLLIRKQVISSEWYYNRMLATFTDNGTTTDYYMLRVREGHLMGYAVGKDRSDGITDNEWIANSYNDYLDMKDKFPHWDFSNLNWQAFRTLIDSSTLFEGSSKLNEDLGIDIYNYIDYNYFFDDQLFNGSTYTLHLDISTLEHDDYWDKYAGHYNYTLELFKLTPEYYYFIKSMSDCQNGSWSGYGVMKLSPTYSNISGGFGAVAGYATSSQSCKVDVKDIEHE